MLDSVARGLAARASVSAHADRLAAEAAAATATGAVMTSFRNRVTNPGFRVWQRGTSFTVSPGGTRITADRWIIWNGTSSTVAVIMASISGWSSRNQLNTTVSGAANGEHVTAYQRYEAAAVWDMDGRSCTLSFDIAATTTAGSLSGVVSLFRNATVDDGAFSIICAQIPFTIPPGSGRVSIPFSALNTLGVSTGCLISIRVQQTGAIGDISNTIGAVQFEIGTVANALEYRPIEIETLLCERDFQTSYDAGTPLGTASAGTGYSRIVDATTLYASIQCAFRTRMRSAPSISLFSPLTGAANKICNANAAIDVDALPNFISTTGFVAFVNNVSVTQSSVIQTSWTADTGF